MSGGELVAESGSAIVPYLHPLVSGPIAPVDPLPEKLFVQTARSIHSGRPWDYIVTRGGEVVTVRLQGSLHEPCSGPVCTTGAYTMLEVIRFCSAT